jgi:hypothetical protein
VVQPALCQPARLVQTSDHAELFTPSARLDEVQAAANAASGQCRGGRAGARRAPATRARPSATRRARRGAGCRPGSPVNRPARRALEARDAAPGAFHGLRGDEELGRRLGQTTVPISRPSSTAPPVAPRNVAVARAAHHARLGTRTPRGASPISRPRSRASSSRSRSSFCAASVAPP